MKGVVAAKSHIDSSFKLFVVYSDYEKYDVFFPLFQSHGHGFMEPGKKNIWVDGESLEDLSMDHLLAIQAHEIAHHRLKHKGEYSMKQEIEADVEGYKILKKLGHLAAAELLKARIKEMGGSKALKEINENKQFVMKTFKQTITENKSGDELYEIKAAAIDWWKKNSNQPTLKPKKKELEKIYNQLLMALDSAIDMVYESEPEK